MSLDFEPSHDMNVCNHEHSENQRKTAVAAACTCLQLHLGLRHVRGEVGEVPQRSDAVSCVRVDGIKPLVYLHNRLMDEQSRIDTQTPEAPDVCKHYHQAGKNASNGSNRQSILLFSR